MTKQMSSKERRDVRDAGLDAGIMSLIRLEQLFADAEYGEQYENRAEGCIVIQSEVREAEAELKEINANLSELFDNVRHGKPSAIKSSTNRLYIYAERLATEAIHIAAAARKAYLGEEIRDDAQTADSAGN